MLIARVGFLILLLPLQVLLMMIFALCDLAWLIRSRLQKAEESNSATLSGLCSIIVLNWNGKPLLAESIPKILKAVESDRKPHQVLVVDNGSTDGSVEWLRSDYPQVDILPLEHNLGFGEGNNKGVQAARHDVVVLLNNDMIVSEDFLRPLLEGLSDPSVFAVTSQVFFPDERRREETGNTRARLERGYLHLSHEQVHQYHSVRKVLPVLWAGGGSSAFRRDRFLELGGFCELFSPCYLEDTDLSYRAWRRGWKVLFAADSKVLHKHRSSSSVRFEPHQLKSLIEQRKLWYLWKNFQVRSLVTHFLLFSSNVSKWLSLSDYFSALGKLPHVLWLRFLEPPRRVNDRQLREWSHHPISYLNLFDAERSARSRRTSDPARILILSAYLPHLGTHGGAGRVFQLLKRTSRHCDITLVTFVEDESDRAFLSQAEKYCRRVEPVLRRRFDPVSYFPYEPFEEFNCRAFRTKLEQVLLEEDFDLAHFEWTQMGLYADLVGDIPKVMTEIEVNYAAHQTLIPVTSGILQKARLYYNTLQTLYREVEMCSRVDRVVTVTDADKNYLAGYVRSEKLKVIHTGVDTRFFDFDPEGSVPGTIVFVGAFRHSPNIDAVHFFVDKVFPQILHEEPSAQFYIVGSSPPAEIQQLGQHPNITVTGFVEDIRPYYRQAQVVVVPLRTGVGIRGKILEGWSAGRAMVATPLACLGLRAEHGENILIADNAQDFAMWTVALLRNPDFCRRLGLKGRTTGTEEYEWDIFGQQVVELYEELVSPKNPGDSSQGPSSIVAKDSEKRLENAGPGRVRKESNV
ncbi:MAG TPA: glycosyltransferase [Acidobacteriota bacterium]|nr:glycosyltransferase [Acidobacteriota bacterium]